MENRFDQEQFKNIENQIAQLQYLGDLLKQHKSALVGDFNLCSLKHTQQNIFDKDENFITLEDDQNSSYTVSLEDIALINKQKSMDTLEAVSYLQAPIETILHAQLPYTFVQNSTITSVATLMHIENSTKIIDEIYGSSVAVVPYMPIKFDLTKSFKTFIETIDLETIDAIILYNNTIITFGNDVQSCYEKILTVENKATEYLVKNGAIVCGDEPAKINRSLLKSIGNIFEKASNCIIDVYKTKNKDIPLQTNLEIFAYMRKKISEKSAKPMLANFDNSKKAVHFSNFEHLDILADSAPLNSYGVQILKGSAMIVGENTLGSIEQYMKNENEYKVPSWAVWENFGVITFAPGLNSLLKIQTVVSNTISSMLKCDTLGGYQSFDKQQVDIIDNEIVVFEEDLETYSGKVALVHNPNNSMGQQIVQSLQHMGAVVVQIDDNDVEKIVDETVKNYGGIDIVVSNPVAYTQEENPTLNEYMGSNFMDHKELLEITLPFLKLGIDPTFIYMTSVKNQDTGYLTANAALEAYSGSKAPQLEEYGIRINCISSNEDESTNDQDVAKIVTLLCSNDFSNSTGTTIIVDASRNHQV